MKVTTEIKFFLRPVNGQRFAFTYYVNGNSVLQVTKTFKDSVPGVNEILIGANATLTAENVLLHLQVNNMIAGMVYSRVGTSVFAVYENGGNIAVANLLGLQDYFSVYVQDAEVIGMVPFDTHSISIEIIDTYENARPLIEEYTQPSAPKLVWDGGDDLYQALITSSLKFNMAVPDAADAKFLHLLTGDEKRYLVKVKNTDTHDTTILLWQGFILPDLYNEPWKNGVPFIEYTAIDMIASLKGKKFDLWFYRQKYNIPVLLGLILAETGLQQEMYVRPTLVNVSHGDEYQWRNMNLSLMQFLNDDKPADLYDMLEKILTAQGLQLFSYRGKWFIEGVTRRNDIQRTDIRTDTTVEIYHPDGVFKEFANIKHETISPYYSEELPVITADTPWKSVNLNLATDAKDGLFPEGVVKKEYFSTRYRYDSDFHDYTYGFINKFHAYWEKVGSPMYQWSDGKTPFLNFSTQDWQHTHTEAEALSNYFECTEKPYAVAGRRYKIELEVLVEFDFAVSPSIEAFQRTLTEGRFNNVLLFQYNVNGTEFLTNRPGNPINKLLQFEKTVTSTKTSKQAAIYKLEYEYVQPQSGYITFRFLTHVGKLNEMGFTLRGFGASPEVMRVSLVKDADDIESVSAERDVNFTKEIDIDVEITCSVDSSILNSFGIGKRLSNQYLNVPFGAPIQFYDTHYQSIDYDVFQPIFDEWEVSYIVAAYLELCYWPIHPFLLELIFRQEQNYSLFLTKPDGSKTHFYSVYSRLYMGVAYMCAYNGFIAPPPGFTEPNLPKDYKPLPVPQPGDILSLMISLYPTENRNLRALWKIHGFQDNTADSYLKTLARAYHAVRPVVSFSLDATALAHVWPTQRPVFRYNNVDRTFLPVRMELDLTEGKTQLTMKEALLTNVNDISYD